MNKNELSAELRLTGLTGSNPFAYLASLGVLAQLKDRGMDCSLSWESGVAHTPTLWLENRVSIESLVDELVHSAETWKNSPALGINTPWKDVKFNPAEAREYLVKSKQHDDAGASVRLASHLIAEGALANKGDSKPTGLHFTSGNQKFLSIAQGILDAVTRARIEEAVFGPWKYQDTTKTLRWDITNDRSYALSAFDPTDGRNNPNFTNTGVEWLALHGLSFFPVFNHNSKAVTTAIGGRWGRQQFTWLLWKHPLAPAAIKSLIGCGVNTKWEKIPREGPSNVGMLHDDLERWLTHLGVFEAYSATIKRTDSGGYGFFAAAKSIWTADTEPS